MNGRNLLRAAWACHATLFAAVMLGIAGSSVPAAGRIALATAAAAPLLLAAPGLYRARRYTFQWLALALVVYAGVAIVEVVASLGRSAAAAVALLAALLEIAFLYLLNRSAREAPRARRE